MKLAKFYLCSVKIVLIRCIQLIGCLCLSTTVFAHSISLSPQEQQFIEQNPVIRIASGASFEPFIFQNNQGQIVGFDRDLADLIEQSTGLSIEFELGVWGDVQNRTVNGEYHGLSSMVKTAQSQTVFNYSQSYINLTPVVIVNRLNHRKIYQASDVFRAKAAVQKDNAAFERLTRELGDVEIIYFDDNYQVLNAIVNNKVDLAVLDESIYYLADKMGISKFITTSFIMDQPSPLHFGFLKQHQELASIFNKALASINPFRLEELKNHWLRGFDTDAIKFSQQEKQYLYQKHSFNYCIDPNWYPFEANEDGEHVGMSADMFDYFQQQLKIPFNLVQTKTWKESLEATKNRRCDWLTLAMRTPEREKYLNFTQPYLSIPLVIATLKQAEFIQDFESLVGKKVGLIDGYAFIELFQQRYPDVVFMPIKSLSDGLDLVEQGQLFGFADSLANISRRIQLDGRNSIKVSGRFDEKFELSVAVPEDDLILLGIFEKLVASISQVQHQTILNKYMAVNYQSYIDYTMVYKLIALFSVIIMIFMFWNQRIHNEKHSLSLLLSQLKEKDQKLEEAYHKLEVISSTDKLTGIFNRRQCDQALRDEINRSQRSNVLFAVFMLDIDHFKRINDTHGHHVGDIFLKQFCQLIGNNIREVDFFGRWGGEEFLLILPATGAEQAVQKAEQLRVLVSEFPFDIVGQQTTCIGISIYRTDDDVNSLLIRADKALYFSKENGRNKVSLLPDE